jgi:hypothetical protein
VTLAFDALTTRSHRRSIDRSTVAGVSLRAQQPTGRRDDAPSFGVQAQASSLL